MELKELQDRLVRLGKNEDDTDRDAIPVAEGTELLGSALAVINEMQDKLDALGATNDELNKLATELRAQNSKLSAQQIVDVIKRDASDHEPTDTEKVDEALAKFSAEHPAVEDTY